MNPEFTDVKVSKTGMCTYSVTKFGLTKTETIDFNKVSQVQAVSHIFINETDDMSHLQATFSKDQSVHYLYMPHHIAAQITCLFQDIHGKPNKKRVKFSCFHVLV